MSKRGGLWAIIYHATAHISNQRYGARTHALRMIGRLRAPACTPTLSHVHDPNSILCRHSSRSERLHTFRRNALACLHVVVPSTPVHLAFSSCRVLRIAIDTQVHQLRVRETVEDVC